MKYLFLILILLLCFTQSIFAAPKKEKKEKVVPILPVVTIQITNVPRLTPTDVPKEPAQIDSPTETPPEDISPSVSPTPTPASSAVLQTTPQPTPVQSVQQVIKESYYQHPVTQQPPLSVPLPIDVINVITPTNIYASSKYTLTLTFIFLFLAIIFALFGIRLLDNDINIKKFRESRLFYPRKLEWFPFLKKSV